MQQLIYWAGPQLTKPLRLGIFPHCKNLRVALTLLWVMSVACSGASIVPSVMSAALSIWTWPPEFLVIYQNGSFTMAIEFLVIYQNGSFTILPQNSCYLSELFLYYGHRISCYLSFSYYGHRRGSYYSHVIIRIDDKVYRSHIVTSSVLIIMWP